MHFLCAYQENNDDLIALHAVIPLTDIAEVRRGPCSIGFRLCCYQDLILKDDCLSIVGSDACMDLIVSKRASDALIAEPEEFFIDSYILTHACLYRL